MDENAVLEIMDFVKFKGRLKTHVMKGKIVEMISDRLKASIPSLASLSKDLELLKLICNCVENCVDKKYKLDKKEIAMAIIKCCFPLLTEADLALIDSNIDTLHFSGLIKRVKYYKKLWRWLTTNKKKD
jgi:hypothetical protein